MSAASGHHSDMEKKTSTPVRVGPQLDITLDDGSRMRLTPTEALTLAELLARRAFQRMASEELRQVVTGPRMWC